MIELQDVYKDFRLTDDRLVSVLKGVDLSCTRGEAVSIVGPSGSGKSTLLNILGSIESPTSGTCTIDGVDLSLLSDEQKCQFRSEKIGFIFQNHRLLPQCNLIENILLPTLIKCSKTPQDVVDYAVQLVGKVGLSDRMDHYPSQLSGGESQRVAVVRSLINHPKVILADEPTGALDSENAHHLMQILRDLTKTVQCNLIVVTHDHEMLNYVDKSFSLKKGQLK